MFEERKKPFGLVGRAMGGLYEYFWSTWTHFWPLVSAGSLLGIEEFTERYWKRGRNILDKILPEQRGLWKAIALILATFYSGYLAWSDEHTKLINMQASTSGAKQRILHSYQISQWNDYVKANKSVMTIQPIIYMSSSADNESLVYTRTIAELFENSKVNAVVQGVGPQLPEETGVILYFQDINKKSNLALAVMKGFDLIKIDYSEKQMSARFKGYYPPAPGFVIFITRENQ